MHPVAPSLILFFGAQSSLEGGAQSLFGGAQAVIWGHGPGMLPPFVSPDLNTIRLTSNFSIDFVFSPRFTTSFYVLINGHINNAALMLNLKLN